MGSKKNRNRTQKKYTSPIPRAVGSSQLGGSTGDANSTYSQFGEYRVQGWGPTSWEGKMMVSHKIQWVHNREGGKPAGGKVGIHGGGVRGCLR